ncbi:MULTISPECIES: inorganic phosphate transporter [Prevotella]|uniref:Phosphate transporter n=1 Tax=Prevotella pectinovora TaxID=1602169 RepID=A0A0D0I5Z7_9BACT|nr:MULTISPECIES: inorganic phosphate transporter [Prevotella]KIP57883.1 phosphate transporter family protein [Prevotella pectinovora]KIP62720.1 phosphate transporter family protein [Prevotella pectinovora]
METIYFVIVAFLLMLAVFDLFVGVSNDAVNFLQSAIGAKVARFRTVLVVASAGVLIGAVMSAGMMDVARHGIMHPANYTFAEVMTIFLAVMVTDVVVLDIFNTLGMPTSTTVSLVFELLGATFILALFKMNADPSLMITDLMNSSKALSVIIAIFVSVAIAFFFGTAVMWLSRLVFTFRYKKHLRYSIAIFGGIAFTALAYFIFIKGLGGSPFISDATKNWINDNTQMLLLAVFVASTILNEILYLLRVNVFKIIVLLGTFALAMAFAGNDLVNFIGVPLAGLDSMQDFMANGNGDPNAFMMTSLMTSAKSPLIYLVLAGIIMIVAMATSKKAQNVVKTSVDLSRQDEGDEMFGSSKVARSLVRAVQDMGNGLSKIMPSSSTKWIDSRFNKEEMELAQGAAFDEVRAAVNLVLAAMLIIIGTNYKLPLSTTYVTFMVAMGTSLADKAWSRDSAVFRVTGVLSVIGGWFVTAGVAFAACALVCTMLHFGGFVVMIAFMVLDIYLLWRSGQAYKKKSSEDKKDDIFNLMMRTKDKDIVWDLLRKHVGRTQSFVTRFTCDVFNKIVDGVSNERLKELKVSYREVNSERETLKKIRRQEFLAMRRIPERIALERNTWFHLGVNCNQQYMYCLRRMLDPIKEHLDNNFQPMPKEYIDEFEEVRRRINELMSHTEQMISTNRYDLYRETLTIGDECKDELSALRDRHINRMQQDVNAAQNLKVSMLYLNMLQESQELISIMRHQLRAARKFLEEDKV